MEEEELLAGLISGSCHQSLLGQRSEYARLRCTHLPKTSLLSSLFVRHNLFAILRSLQQWLGETEDAEHFSISITSVCLSLV